MGGLTAAPPSGVSAPRKLRVLAVHGGYSNSNVMKFQLAHLRKHLGKNVEWLLPDAMIPQHPYAAVPENNIFPELSSFETRLAQGKQLCSWYVLAQLESGVVITEPESQEGAVQALRHFMEREVPIDLAVGFSQGALMIAFLAARLKKEGLQVPWQLALFFAPSNPTLELRLGEKLSFPVVHITSPTDPHYLISLESYAEVFSDWRVLEHDDGYAFPSTQPRATQIYEHLAREVKKRCQVASADSSMSGSEQHSGGTSKELDRGEAGEGSMAAPPAAADRLRATSPSELAELLRAGSCIVVDTRDPHTRSRQDFPRCSGRGDLSFGALRRNSEEVQQQLSRLRGDGRELIAVSRLGDDLDCEYCEMLVKRFGFALAKVRWLAGGLRAWASWELDNRAAADHLRLAAGLPVVHGPSVQGVSASELAEMLQEGQCTVVDVREPAEARGKAFPGARKDISLRTLQTRADDAELRLAQLCGDGRRLVAVSVTGGRCWRYCSLLVNRFKLPRDLVFRLEGGLRSWVAWEAENGELGQSIRELYGLSTSRGRLAAAEGDTAGQEAERELSLQALGLLV